MASLTIIDRVPSNSRQHAVLVCGYLIVYCHHSCTFRLSTPAPPPPWAHPDNSHEESLCLSTEVLNLKLSKSTIAFFGVIIIGSCTERYTQYACSQTWHSMSYRNSLVSLILTRENILTRGRIISVGSYKVTILNPNSNKKLTLSYLCILIIVSVHYTEVKPGPCRPRHPCQLCNKVSKWSQKGVRCDNCFGWYVHADCISMNTVMKSSSIQECSAFAMHVVYLTTL